MKKETMEEFLARGGEVHKIIDTTAAYRRKYAWCGPFVKYTSKETLKKHLEAYKMITETKLKESKQGEIK